MKIKAWPFLIGRSKVLPYQVIVSPPFLLEQGLTSLLLWAANTDDAPTNSVIFREIQDASVGNISLIFRAFTPREQDYNLGGTDLLKDSSGRSFDVIEGVVVQEVKQAKNIHLTQEDLKFIHMQLQDTYKAFWHAEKNFSAQQSQPFDLQTGADTIDKDDSVRVVPPINLSSPQRAKATFSSSGSPITTIILTTLACLLLFGIGLPLYNLFASLSSSRHPSAPIVMPSPTHLATSSPTPIPRLLSNTLNTFCTALKQEDYTLAYNQLSNPIIDGVKFKDFFTQNGQRVTGCPYKLGESNGYTIFATIHVIFSGSRRPTLLHLSLLRDRTDAWTINTFPLPTS